MRLPDQKTERLHSLDSLRAIMMILGLVIHSAITYGTSDWGSTWSLKDPNATHWTNDYTVMYIHAFRMQIFFFVAGFFGAMIFYERGLKCMVSNRLSRILYPLFVFVFLLWPTIVFSFVYTGSVFSGNPDAGSESVAALSHWRTYLPQRTFHLWFLYYLLFLTATGVLIALALQKLPGFATKILGWHHAIIKRPILRVLVFASISASVYFLLGMSQVNTSTSWVPDFDTYIYYTVFYLAGWVMFKSKHHLVDMMRFDWGCTFFGTVLFSITYFFGDTLSYGATLIMKSIMVWCLIYGITGLFIRYASHHSALMRYVSDGSYWVFLIHLSFTAILPGLIADWPVPATVKFLIVLTTSAVICFVSYHYLVRKTFIGQFLNGRRYS